MCRSTLPVARTASAPPAKAFAAPAIVGVLLTDVGAPLLAVAALALSLVGSKALRRRRRRASGPPTARVTGAWRELVDLGRDLGIAPAPAAAAATRLEIAWHAEAGGLP